MPSPGWCSPVCSRASTVGSCGYRGILHWDRRQWAIVRTCCPFSPFVSWAPLLGFSSSCPCSGKTHWWAHCLCRWTTAEICFPWDFVWSCPVFSEGPHCFGLLLHLFHWTLLRHRIHLLPIIHSEMINPLSWMMMACYGHSYHLLKANVMMKADLIFEISSCERMYLLSC